MKIGTVSIAQIAANGGVLSARYYLDRCSNCGGERDNPRHHQDGKCGRYKTQFVPAGTSWANANEQS